MAGVMKVFLLAGIRYVHVLSTTGYTARFIGIRRPDRSDQKARGYSRKWRPHAQSPSHPSLAQPGDRVDSGRLGRPVIEIDRRKLKRGVLCGSAPLERKYNRSYLTSAD